MKRTVFPALIAGLLFGCGGGDSPESPPSPPTVHISLSESRVFVGEAVTLTWSSTNASACEGTDAWSGSQAAEGSAVLRPTAGGRLTYTLRCAEAGGTAEASATLVVPMPVFPTSYENKNHIHFDATQVLSLRVAGFLTEASEQDTNDRSVTFGDFFQEGDYAAFVVANRATGRYGIENLTDAPGKAYFLARDRKGNWVDRTASLIPNAADRYTCVSSSYSMTTDFNNDKKPDVWVACTGLDHDIGLPYGSPEWRDAYLSESVLFLSQPDGTYRKFVHPRRMYAHQAAAADLNGDGFADILTINQVDPDERMPLVLLGRGDGTFVEEAPGRLPANLFDYVGQNDGLYGVQLIPIDGRLDVIFGGEKTIWMKGDGAGGFLSATAREFVMPVAETTGKKYQFPLDVIYRSGSFYLVTNDASPLNEWLILKIDMTSLAATEIFRRNRSNAYSEYDGTVVSGGPQYKPTADGFLVPYTGWCQYRPNDARYATSFCASRIPL